MELPKFEFSRARGIVWVCDLSASSTYLNSEINAAAIEDFLPRFHWISRLVVQAAGGEYIKWTGDGFLSWFPITLHRDLGKHAADVFNAAWHLTFLINITTLGVFSTKPFRIRHGITYEQDALITKVHFEKYTTTDLVGRAVVLAFRLSSIKAQFPGITTQGELVNASKKLISKSISFQLWKPSPDDLLKYFKGEKLGTSSLYVSISKKLQLKNVKSVLINAERTVKKAKSPVKNDADSLFCSNIIKLMAQGPNWCQQCAEQYVEFIREKLLGSIEALIPVLKKLSMAPR